MIEARGLTKRYGSTTAALSPWLGLGVFFLYAVVALGAAAFTLVHRDA